MRKVTIDASSNTEKRRIYDGQWELYTHKTAGTIDLTRETLHIMDDKARIALVDTPTFNTTGSGETQNLRYQFSNHLSTGTLELDFNAANISYEEYYPFGSTSFQSGRSAAEVSLKRYRYTAKERDEETGLYYHGARYYAPWLGRWIAVDPINNETYNLSKGQPNKNIKRDYIELTASSYEYCYANPVRFSDPKGEQVPASQVQSKVVNQPVNPADHTRVAPVIVDPTLTSTLSQARPAKVQVGNINYYVERAKDFEKRHPGQKPPSYYLNYGNVYIHKFTEQTKSTLSPEGQKWLDKALVNLQLAIEDKLRSTNPKDWTVENNDKAFTDFAFDTHVAAYEKAGVLQLSIMDKVKIMLTPKAEDLFSDRGLKQATQIGKDLAVYYLKHPGFAFKQAKEAWDNKSQILDMVHKYYQENKKFFDDAAKTNPQQWSDPEHKIIGFIRDIIFPTFSF